MTDSLESINSNSARIGDLYDLLNDRIEEERVSSKEETISTVSLSEYDQGIILSATAGSFLVAGVVFALILFLAITRR